MNIFSIKTHNAFIKENTSCHKHNSQNKPYNKIKIKTAMDFILILIAQILRNHNARNRGQSTYQHIVDT